MDKAQILDTVKKQSIELVEMQFSDIDGMVKSVTIPHHKLGEALERGVWFDGSSIEGFTRISESDMFLRPDCETFRLIPWRSNNGHKAARMLCEVHMPSGKPFDGDPRAILRRAVEKAGEMGFAYYTGPEVE